MNIRTFIDTTTHSNETQHASYQDIVTVLFRFSFRRGSDLLLLEWTVRGGVLHCLLAFLIDRFLFLGAALFQRLLGSVGATEACAVLDCNNSPRCPSCIALLLPLWGKEDQFFPLFETGGPLRGFPWGTHGQTW